MLSPRACWNLLLKAGGGGVVRPEGGVRPQAADWQNRFVETTRYVYRRLTKYTPKPRVFRDNFRSRPFTAGRARNFRRKLTLHRWLPFHTAQKLLSLKENKGRANKRCSQVQAWHGRSCFENLRFPKKPVQQGSSLGELLLCQGPDSCVIVLRRTNGGQHNHHVPKEFHLQIGSTILNGGCTLQPMLASILWVDQIRSHHVETMRNHELLVFTLGNRIVPLGFRTHRKMLPGSVTLATRSNHVGGCPL